MPSLPEVTETFEASVAPYIAGLDAMISAAERARDMNLELLASIDLVNESLDATAAAAAEAAFGVERAGALAQAAAGQVDALEGALRGVDYAAQNTDQALIDVGASMTVAGEAAGTLRDELQPAASRLNDLRSAAASAAAPVSRAASAVRDLSSAAARASGTLATNASRVNALSRALAGVDIAGSRAESRLNDVGVQAMLLTFQLDSLDAELDKKKAALGAVAFDATALAIAMRALSAGTNASTGATQRNAVAIGRWGLTWNAVHWIIAGGAELLAVTIPAAIAAAAGAFVMYQGVVEQVVPRMNSLYGAAEATGKMLHTTAGDALGLGHAFQTAQDAANPVAYQLLGSYLNAARSHMINLAAAGLQVSRAVSELAARINVDLLANGGRLSALLNNMVPDLIQLGQVFGNVGHAVLNLASDMPGLAEVLLRIADAVSRVILWVSQLPAPLITAFMVFEELNRWGGLLVTGLGRVGLATSELGGRFLSLRRAGGILANLFLAIPMLASRAVIGLGNLISGFGRLGPSAARAGATVRNVGEDMTAAFRAIPVWQAGLIGLGVAGFLFLAYKMSQAKDSTQRFTDSLQKAAEAATNVSAFAVIATNISQIGTQSDVASAQLQHLGGAATSAGIVLNNASLNGTQPLVGGFAQLTRMSNGTIQSLDQVHSAGADANNGFAQLAGTVAHLWASFTGATDATAKVQELSHAEQQQETDMTNLVHGGQAISKMYGGTLAQAYALADVAGVKLDKTQVILGKNANVAGMQIMNLVAGYKAMDQTGGILNNDMNALAVQAGLQTTKVQQLNQAWDQFLSNATGLTSNFASLITDVGQINNAITSAGTRFSVFGGKAVSSTQAAALALRSFSGVGAQVWQNYDAALEQAQKFTDSLRTAAAYGGITQTAFRQQIAYTAQQLLPYAQYSKTAAEELSVLVQEASGPATDNFKKLKAWIDHNGESAAQFNKQLLAETGQMSDVSKAASEFASTLDTQVASALDSAKISTANLTGAAQQLDNAYQRTHGTVSGPVISAFSGLVTSLFKVYGNTKTAEGIANAYARSLGFNQKQVAALDTAIQGLINQLNSIPNINRTISFNYVNPPPGTSTSPNPATRRYQAGAAYVPPGLALVGDNGPELIRFAGGEQVTPAWQTAPILHGGGGGGEGMLNFTAPITVNVGGQRMQSQVVTQSAIFNRRNSSNLLSLRTRG